MVGDWIRVGDIMGSGMPGAGCLSTLWSWGPGAASKQVSGSEVTVSFKPFREKQKNFGVLILDEDGPRMTAWAT